MTVPEPVDFLHTLDLHTLDLNTSDDFAMGNEWAS